VGSNGLTLPNEEAVEWAGRGRFSEARDGLWTVHQVGAGVGIVVPW
jgi:hypothetical protein